MATPPLLIVAAFAPELAPLRPLLGEAMRARVGAVEVVAMPVGIGIPASAVGTSLAIARERPRAVLLVGSCGGFVEHALARGSVITARAIHLVDGSVCADAAAFPGPMTTVLPADDGWSATLALHGARAVDVATTLAVTTSASVAATVASRTGCAVEHLEAFGVAAACARADVPIAVLLGVSNDVGPDGRAQWKAHGAQAHDAVIAMATQWLTAGAAGLPTR